MTKCEDVRKDSFTTAIYFISNIPAASNKLGFKCLTAT